MVGRKRGRRDRKRECRVSCSSVTCILVRVRPKDVVHSRLYRPFVGEKEGNAEEGRERERREKRKKLWSRDPRHVLLNGVGVSARMEE